MSDRNVVALGALVLALHGPLSAQEGTTFVVRESAMPCLNVRTRPQPAARVLTCLTPDTQVPGLGTAPYWREVRLPDGRSGWAAKQFLEVVAGPAAAVAPPAAPPAAAAEALTDAWLEVHVVDVGQGDGIWIHTPDDGTPGNGRFEGRNIVIDGGPDGSDARNELLKYLQRLAPEGADIDALILTHPHNDHYPGALGILRHFEVHDYYDSGFPKEGPQFAGFLDAVRAERADGAPIHLHMGPDQFGTPDWGSELEVEFLYAYPGSPDGLGSGNTLENNASIVLRLTYGDQSLLFMGDAEGKDRSDSPDTPKYVERLLLDSPGAARLKSTILKIAHHGSETSSTLPFIEAVDPDYVIVSSGRKSFSGTFLPDRSTLARYCARKPGTRIFRTDQDDEDEGRTTQNDTDGDHVLIRMNGTSTIVDAFSGGVRVTPTACVP